MPTKDDKIEFRCTAAMKSRLLEYRPLLGARTLSEAARKLLDRLTDGPDSRCPWGAIPALKEIAIHLDRIASALQRCLLDGSLPKEHLTDLAPLLARVRELLDGPKAPPSAEQPQPIRRRPH